MTVTNPAGVAGVPEVANEFDTVLPKPSTDEIENSSLALAPPVIDWPASDRAGLLETVFANSADVVLAFDRAGKLLDINPAGCALASAIRPEEVRGQFVDRWIAEEHRKSFHDALKALALGRRVEARFDFITRAGERRKLSARLIPLRGADGLALFVAVCQDRTEALQWECNIRERQKSELVGRVAGEVVHDFNNLLTVINGFSEIAVRGVDKDNPLSPILRDLRQAGEKAAHLSRQFLAFSRRRAIDVRTVDLRDMALEMESILRHLLGREIELLVSFDPGAATIRGDAGQIEQALLNLVVNARDAMPQGGRVTIAVRPVPAFEIPASCPNVTMGSSYVLLSVRDTGRGMDAQTKRRIFEPFFTTKAPGQGAGLGLTTVAKAVEQNAGLIEVLSDPGRGATFNLYFPRDQS
jgi:two-component system cell cycle sensor histidine kinase/response regulator CckA